jgi:pimeloyl-ACP methyl ester carboxylesterase
LNSLTLSAPAGIHVKGLSKGDIFLWSAAETVRNLVHDPALAEKMLAQPPTEAQQFAEMKNRLTMAKLAWQPRLYNPHLAKWLHRIGVPTLILWGDDDKIIPAGYGPAFRDLIPGARLETIANCGHLPHIERMEEWTDRISGFIAGVAP